MIILLFMLQSDRGLEDSPTVKFHQFFAPKNEAKMKRAENFQLQNFHNKAEALEEKMRAKQISVFDENFQHR